MGLLDPTPTPYDPMEWVRLPLGERGRLVCEAWAMDGYGTPPAVYLLYAFKVALYVGAWVFFCTLSPSLGGVAQIGQWWLEPLAYQKAICWSMLFEGLGLGCGSGPLTGRYLPPVGGFLYWMRRGTTKLPLWPRLPILGGHRRGLLDVAVYAALVIALVFALTSATLEPALLWTIVVFAGLIGVLDRTIFLALRAEHYWVTLIVFAASDSTPQMLAGAMIVQLAIWFWAGFSKLNHHFPAVVCVMTSNSPLTRFRWLRRLFYRDFPSDLRPSRLAVVMGHAGTALEMGVPAAFVFAQGAFGIDVPEGALFVALGLMLSLHFYITSNVPMGVPIEWNFMVVYAAFALFYAHPEVHVWDLDAPLLGALLFVCCFLVPLAGNLFPERISFLLSMRYYAGNWAYGVWLFRGASHEKLAKLKKSSAWIYDQLSAFYDEKTSRGLVGKVVGFRLMHLHGRMLPKLVPKAVDDLSEYEWLDGELVAGLVLGWNFGDGHLHHEQLLEAVQTQCGFEPGELRCIFVESEPLLKQSLGYRIVDAHDGLMHEGRVATAELQRAQPYDIVVTD